MTTMPGRTAPSDETAPVPLRRNVRFQALWIGSAASELGSKLTWLAFPLLIMAVTGSAGLAGVAATCRLAVNMALSLPAGVWVDRLDRRRILIGSDAVRAVAIASLAVAVLADGVTMAHVIAVAVVVGAADACYGPGMATAIRAVVPKRQLPSAYAREESRSQAASLAGPPLGGFLFAVGHALPFLVDAVTYLVSLCCVLIARVPRRPDSAAPPRKTAMRADIAEAGKWLWRQHALRAGLACTLVVNLAVNALLLPLIVLVGERGGGPGVVGLVLAGLGLGGLVGATLSARIGGLLPPGRLMLLVIAFFALATALTTLPFGPLWPAVPLFLAMVAVPALNVVLRVLLAVLVPGDMMGRLVALISVATMGLTPLSPLLGGMLAEFLGGTTALLVVAGLLAAGALPALMSPALRDLAHPTAIDQQRN